MKTIKFPSKGTVFDYFVQEARLEEWTMKVDTLDYSSETPMNEVKLHSKRVKMKTTLETSENENYTRNLHSKRVYFL
jgi:hypothetical protein